MKFIAGILIATASISYLFLAIATIWFRELSTIAEREQGRWEAGILLALGCILWQLTSIKKLKGV